MLVGLVGVHFGLAWADSVAALVVAVLVCVAGWRLGHRTIDTLTDVAPPGAADEITAIAAKVPGVVRVGQVRARAVGETTFIELAVAVSRTLPIDRVNAIKAEVAAAIRAQDAGRRADRHHRAGRAQQRDRARPRDGDRAQPRARRASRDGARNRRPAGRRARSRSRRQALAAAPRTNWPTGWKTPSPRELGPGVEVETHIEPLQAQDALGREAPPERVKAVTLALAELAAEGRVIRDVHDVRVRETDDGEIVNFHCRVDPELTVQTVHENVDALERALRERSPSIKRVIGHAEPMR